MQTVTISGFFKSQDVYSHNQWHKEAAIRWHKDIKQVTPNTSDAYLGSKAIQDELQGYITDTLDNILTAPHRYTSRFYFKCASYSNRYDFFRKTFMHIGIGWLGYLENYFNKIRPLHLHSLLKATADKVNGMQGNKKH